MKNKCDEYCSLKGGNCNKYGICSCKNDYDTFINEKSKERGWGKDMKDVYVRLREKVHDFQPNIKFSDLSVSAFF